ncbi:CoF synthetase [Halovibrio salipaludis]|uniref:CoF synthetase n=2 Tax=Halovibrio salipaludis TaxID=2032626 RepID=A0A2A2F8G0_9GAMM|nr:CoF synthetase [Halovibrio salipaludis]
MRLIRSFRCLLARSLFLAMGLRIGYWRKAVERAWAMESREEYLESILKKVAPRDANGNPVKTYAELKTAPILTKKAFRHSASRPNKSAVFHRHTAGSSGDPTSIWLNRQELGRMLGVRDYCYRHCGIRVGDREGRLWGRPETGLKSRVKNFVLNRRVFHTSGRNLEKEIQELIEWRPDYLYGYASLLMECARQLKQNGQMVPGLKCVIVTAETILPSQKEHLSRIFRCPVHEEYGASEFDIIAFECRSGHRHLVNPWLLLESGPEEQALVTDVSRSSQSLVRYELGDILQLSTVDCPGLGSTQIISLLEGRTSNRFAFTAENERFHAVEFAYAVDQYQQKHGDLFQFVVTQVRPGVFGLVCSPEPKEGTVSVAKDIEMAIQRSAGYEVKVETQSGLERQGKTSYFVQTINATNSGAAMGAVGS